MCVCVVDRLEEAFTRERERESVAELTQDPTLNCLTVQVSKEHFQNKSITANGTANMQMCTE